jgi:multicomponent Na+:H+ antiporter subunit D
VPATMEWVALVLASGSILLGLIAAKSLALFEVGDPFNIISNATPQ